MEEKSNADVVAANADIQADVIRFQDHVREHERALRTNGIWLFLASLGCWSVTNQKLQYMAFALTLFIFAGLMKDATQETKSYDKLLAAIRSRIEALLPDGDIRKARLYDVDQLERVDLGWTNISRRNLMFFACWTFFGLSLIHAIWR